MNETTTTKKSEFVFRRVAESFDQFTGDVFTVAVGNPLSIALLSLLALIVAARVAYRVANPASRAQRTGDASSVGVAWGVVATLAVFALIHESLQLYAAARGQDFPIWRILVAGVAEVICLAILGGVCYALVQFFRPSSSVVAAPRDVVALALALTSGLVAGATVVWWLTAYFAVDSVQGRGQAETLATNSANNEVKWYAFVIGLFALGSVFVGWMYVRDTRTVRWFVAAPLALLRITVYAILCVVFLLPAMQTWEDTNKQSRVVILLDISPSMTDPRASDEIGTKTGKLRTRMDILIEFLSDEKIAFMKNLLEKNPVAVYAFGTRLDEAPLWSGPASRRGRRPTGRRSPSTTSSPLCSAVCRTRARINSARRRSGAPARGTRTGRPRGRRRRPIRRKAT